MEEDKTMKAYKDIIYYAKHEMLNEETKIECIGQIISKVFEQHAFELGFADGVLHMQLMAKKEYERLTPQQRLSFSTVKETPAAATARA